MLPKISKILDPAGLVIAKRAIGTPRAVAVAAPKAAPKEENKKRFIEDLKKDKRIRRIEVSGDIYSYELELPKSARHVQLFYNRSLLFLKPVIHTEEGFEYWELASWERKNLIEFINKLTKHMDHMRILKLKQTKLKDVYFPMIMPKLTKEQKMAIELAYRRGYYSYPRKIKLKDLAKESGLSISTFQEHLRKAEIKLLPNLIEGILKNKPE